MNCKNSISCVGFALGLMVLGGCGNKVEEKIVYVEVLVPGPSVTVAPEVSPSPDASAVITVAATGAAAGQSALGSGSVGGTAANGSSPSDFVMAGSLVLPTAGAGLALAAPQYALYCVTFTEPVKTCRIEIDGTTYKFKHTCSAIGGQSFGCFVRQNDATVATVDFNGKNSVTAGFGELSSVIVLNTQTKSARAIIDAEKSTALDPENVGRALEKNGGAVTSLPDLSAMWKVSCEEDPDNGFGCDNLQGIPSTLFTHPFQNDGDQYFGFWKNRSRHDICVPAGTTDMSPRFALALGNGVGGTTSFALNYASTSTLQASLDSFWNTMSTSANSGYQNIKTQIDSTAMKSYKLQQCNYSFTGERCKFALELYNVDCGDGSGGTCQSSIAYRSFSEYSLIDSYLGTVTSTANVACIYTWNKSDEDPEPACPGWVPWSDYTYDNDNKWRAHYTRYTGVNSGNQVIPLMIACKEFGADILRVEAARGATLQAALTAVNNSSACTDITSGTNPGSPFIGYKQIEREAVHDTILQLAAAGQRNYSRITHLCDGLSKPLSWDFTSCESGDATARDAFAVCHPSIYPYLKDYLGLKVDTGTGKLIVDSDLTPHDTQGYAPIFCPASYDTFNADVNTAYGAAVAVQPDSSTDYTAYFNFWYTDYEIVADSSLNSWPHRYATLISSLNLSCRNSFAQRTLAAQINLLQDYILSNAGFWPATHPYFTTWDYELVSLTQVFCKLSSADSALLSAGMSKACVPDSSLDTYDANGQPVRNLRCNGSESGDCYQDGFFNGKVQDLINIVGITNGVNRAFNFHSEKHDAWFTKYGAAQRPGWCKESSAANFDGAYTDDSHFGGLYKVSNAKTCGVIAGQVKAGQDPKISDSDSTAVRNFVRFNLTRCVDDTCVNTVDDP